ncbi:PilX N-terminal domain-containing pilus assembly protein [Halomonas sp. MCCC 1A11062]|uniref:pilus assembly PilX family protein n=1 Tax=Halomonas sp. MCCC 1A11062 TaxID=2733485 RepID=UPI001F36824B|nr:PilX N-terminal domain-containing pilus assembly protein [Halomonas sp. MCCC 1A11062]MCE8039016.1 hypothetical protein [Halomonas sp. MCCC 1A11062]
MKKQRGAALVVVLSLLAMSLMLGISGMQSSQIDERLAGNYRSSSLAMMAAEYGASTALQSENRFSAPVCGVESVVTATLSAHVQYQYTICQMGSGNLFRLVSDGYTLAGQDIISERNVEVFYHKLGGLLSLSPITLPGHINSFDSPNSNSFGVEGETVLGVTSPAISTAGYKGFIEDNISKNRISNYKGGISDEIGVDLLKDANEFHRFMSALWGVAVKESRVFSPGDTIDFGAKTGEVEDARLTFVNGDFTSSGNFSGSGVLVVNGDVDFSGTPSFDGIIIVLGDYKVSGGGGGQGEFNGSILISPYSKVNSSNGEVFYDNISNVNGAFEVGEGEYSFSQPGANISFSGGGNALYNYDFRSIDNACLVMGGACDFFNEAQGVVSEIKVLSWGGGF